MNRTPFGLAIVFQVLGGFFGAVVLGVLTYLLIGFVVAATPFAQQLGMGLLVVQLYGGLLAAAIGAAAGIAVVGRLLGYHGSFGLAVAMALLSGIVVLVLVRLTTFLRGIDLFVQIALIALITLLVAVVGYHLRRPALADAKQP